MNASRRLLLLMSCLILLLSFSSVFDVQAQETGPWVYLSPDPSYIYIDGSNEVTVDIMVQDVVIIGGFDVKVVFDNTVVNFLGYELGDFLKNLYCTNQYIEPNSVRLVCVQIATPGQTGGGSLFRMKFQGVAEGSTVLDITRAQLAATDDQLILPGMTDGTLNVVNTGSFIYLPLIMNVSVQGALNRGGIEVALGRGTNFGMGPYFGTSINDSDENLEITGVVADSYRISTNQPRVLNITPEMNKIFTLASGATHVPALLLVPGNAVWTDNEINDDDVDAVLAAWGDVTLNPDADVNFDGAVDARDLALVAGNFGLNSGTAYAAWLP